MENIFHRQSHSLEPNVMKSSSSAREPLRQRSMNSQPRSSSGKDAIAKFPLQQRSTNAMPSSREQFSQKPSSSSSHRSSKSSSSSRSEPVEIVERRKRSDGEGYTYHRYTRGKMLGKGGFAKVYLCTAMDTERQYAVKIVPKANLTKQRARQKLQAEIKIHRSLKHSHICEFKHFFEDHNNCYILLELCQNQSMNELIKRRKRLTEPEVKYYMSQLLKSTKFMHSNKVIHRDLKLGNLFLDKNLGVKVGDFGLATQLSDESEKRKTVCGTPNYIAPEVIQNDKEKRGHSFEVDIWSIGVICYTLLVGKPPYESKDVKSTYQRIIRNEYHFPSHIPISQDARDLISSMLQTRPDKRPKLDQLVNHPFFTHDPTKIPRSLPSCCTHVAPDWQEDQNGYLVPVLAEADEKKYGSSSKKKTSSKPRSTLEEITNVEPQREKHYHGKEGRVSSRKPAGQFEIFSEESPREDTARPEQRDRVERDHVQPQAFSPDDIGDRLAACEIDDGDQDTKASPNTDVDADTLGIMYSRLKDLGEQVEANGGEPISFKPARPLERGGADKWVTRYVDYTSKYGLGFLFNDGSAGVYFNDSTKAVLMSDNETFIYVERKKSSDGNGTKIEQIPQYHKLSDHPESLQKKVTLLKHFRNYLIEQHKRDDSKDEIQSNENVVEEEDALSTVFLKKWVRTKHAILFRLSNQTVQVVFYDHTEILLSSEARIVTYANKKHERETFELDDVMLASEHADIKKRLKYAEVILQQLVTGNQQK